LQTRDLDARKVNIAIIWGDFGGTRRRAPVHVSKVVFGSVTGC
jgi:hypothetical protein